MTFLYISKNLTIQIIESSSGFINKHLYAKPDNTIYNKRIIIEKFFMDS